MNEWMTENFYPVDYRFYMRNSDENGVQWQNRNSYSLAEQSSEKIVINFLQFPFTHAKRAAIVINFLVQRFDWNKNVYQTELSKC